MLGRYREPVRVWTDPVGRALFRLRLRPNHLTILGLGVSFLAAAAFIAGHLRSAGVLLALAGLCDFFDGSLARASGQVTAFGAFLDSVIDRYSDLVVLLAIVVLFARMPHARGAVVAMAGLIGSMMVSYTKARAESIGVQCTVGMMERPERMICLIAGALLGLLEPALWILAILSNLTALQRIAFTRRAARAPAVLRVVAAGALLLAAGGAWAEPKPALAPERAWAQAVEALQGGDPAPLVREFSREAARQSVIGDHLRLLLAEALATQGDLAAARAAALGVADRYRTSRLAPRALLLAATLDFRAGQDAAAQPVLARLVDAFPEAPEAAGALYLLGMSAEALGQLELAARTYRELRILAPASGYADGAGDRFRRLESLGVKLPPLSLAQRIDRAERLLHGGVSDVATSEAERIVDDTREGGGVLLRALRVVADGARKLRRWDVAARALELLIARAPAEQQPALRLESARLIARGSRRERALALFDQIARSPAEAEAAQALWERGRLLEDLDRPAEAAEAYRALAARWPEREIAAAGLWRLGWLAWLAGDVRGAGESWTRLTGPTGGPYRAPGLYWAARARERSGGNAARLYQQVLAEAPRTYYGVLAAARLGNGPTRGTKAALALPPEPGTALAHDPGWARVDLLRRIGLVEHAWQELEDVVQRAAGDPVKLYGFSGAYVQEARYHLALRILRKHFAAPAATGDPALPRAFWEMLYPFGWRGAVEEAARQTGLDPLLVAAVVREESSYHPRAVSPAGARGLMQLMPGTAKPMPPGGDLDDPALNLRIGARFLAGLLRDFGDPRLALAAYNAGPKRLRQWWSVRRSDDVEAFVEQIPYDETRHYVKRVMLSWDEYRRIWGGSAR
ncbi:MAG: transglycosylase SLT domain-containing protein [Candidatus Rokubacteria bacterium]|nr:transglycosylase SLT domain-containing protein [Candidatus Rokubacteria bacterium]